MERYISNLRLLVREYMKRLKEGNAVKNNIDIRIMVAEYGDKCSIIDPQKMLGTSKEWNGHVAEVENELGLAPLSAKITMTMIWCEEISIHLPLTLCKKELH